MDESMKAPQPAWPMRSWILAVLGALLALVIQQLGDLPDSDWEWGRRLIASAMLFLGIGGLAFSLVWQRGRHVPAVILALVCGGIAGGVMLWNGVPGGRYGSFDWSLLCGLVAAGFFLTLFQVAQERHPHWPARWSLFGLRDWKRRALSYEDVHAAMWTDALLIGASLLFAGIAFLVANLLAEMFMLVDIDLLRTLLRKDWIAALLVGGSLGGAMGILRDRAAIITALQRVAMIVLRVLAPVLAVGLVLFLAVLPFTGLAPLWATGNTTPLMLSGALVALLLVNAVIGERDDEAAVSLPLRWGAWALALVLLPLVLIAAWSTGLRIGQYGLSPDRLWALTFIILATVTAITYAVAVLRRGDRFAHLYRSNLHLAFILGGVSLLLSTALVSFERIATADQLARLERGAVSPLDFDYRGLWFDFGPPGRAAIERLAESADSDEVRGFAAAAQKLESRYMDAPNVVARRSGAQLDDRLTILPEPVALDPALRARLTDYNVCGETLGQACILRYVPGETHAVAISMPEPGCDHCLPVITALFRDAQGAWTNVPGDPLARDVGSRRPDDIVARKVEAIRTGKVEMRTVERRQIFIDGEPYGPLAPLSVASDNAAEP